MPPQDPEVARWFATEVQPHEPMLRAWLKSHFSNAADIDDIVQVAFVRILRAHETSVIRSPKAFLFVIARNLALSQVRHARIENADSLAQIDGSGILDEGTDVPQAVARAQELEMLTQAVQTLPTRCRQVLTLRKIYGLSIRDTAKDLGIAEHTVVIQTAIGIKKVTDYFRENGLTEECTP